jgi:hypothetical protein
VEPDKDLLERLKTIASENDGDEETIHVKMDNELCRVLKNLGYAKSVDFFYQQEKWYA